MKTYLALFTCAENSANHEAWKKLDTKTQKERFDKGMTAKGLWEEKYKNQVIYDGGPLGEHTKLVDKAGIHDFPSRMGAFLVVQANSHEEAAVMFREHPHFAFFPGDGVEILERTEGVRR